MRVDVCPVVQQPWYDERDCHRCGKCVCDGKLCSWLKQEEKASILADAYKYIEKLQRQVEELYYELGTESCFEEGSSCCEDDFSLSHRERTLETNADSESSSGSEFGYSQPTV